MKNYSSRTEAIESTIAIWSQFRRQKLPLRLFLALCLNLLIAPAVFATTESGLSRSQSYWIGALGLVTVALAIYLFFVMFAPEKF
ncbi:MAG: K(+)-transporting ATPase subunit F [Leptolyngbyaceae cyanobacterium SM1_3_5]|nr:K(+)-transporting ATPase subunit F [Leptolyngbyaceae cyanobacterium SM1_3_5]